MAFRFPHSLKIVPVLLVAAASVACGDKGDDGADDDLMNVGGMGSGGNNSGVGGATSAKVLYGFDSGVESFKFEVYTPDDTTYTNIAADSSLSHDSGNGADSSPGRLEIEGGFDGYNQLLDIQVNFGEEDWSGKTLRASVMLDSGFSPDPSAPGGAYLFVKTGADWVWAKGSEVNLPPDSAGTWQKLAFRLDAPSQSNTGYDPTLVKALGIQFYSGGGGAELPAPEPAVLYVDQITLE